MLSLAKARKVEVVTGRAYFESDNAVRVETDKGQEMIEFDKAIVAVGSKPILPPAFDLGNKRIMTSKEALDIEDIPKKSIGCWRGIYWNGVRDCICQNG